VDASVGVGTLKVSVPRRVRLELDASVSKGRIDPYVMNGIHTQQGFDQHVRSSGKPARAGAGLPTIRLSAQVGLGAIEVSGPEGLAEEKS
jgi:hypothetical protein